MKEKKEKREKRMMPRHLVVYEAYSYESLVGNRNSWGRCSEMSRQQNACPFLWKLLIIDLQYILDL